jgi:hypothetical protein
MVKCTVQQVKSQYWGMAANALMQVRRAKIGRRQRGRCACASTHPIFMVKCTVQQVKSQYRGMAANALMQVRKAKIGRRQRGRHARVSIYLP